MPSYFCPGCGEWGCNGECDADYESVCPFCGEWDCDRSGYNCLDEHYQTYNEQPVPVRHRKGEA